MSLFSLFKLFVKYRLCLTTFSELLDLIFQRFKIQMEGRFGFPSLPYLAFLAITQTKAQLLLSVLLFALYHTLNATNLTHYVLCKGIYLCLQVLSHLLQDINALFVGFEGRFVLSFTSYHGCDSGCEKGVLLL